MHEQGALKPEEYNGCLCLWNGQAVYCSHAFELEGELMAFCHPAWKHERAQIAEELAVQGAHAPSQSLPAKEAWPACVPAATLQPVAPQGGWAC